MQKKGENLYFRQFLFYIFSIVLIILMSMFILAVDIIDTVTVSSTSGNAASSQNLTATVTNVTNSLIQYDWYKNDTLAAVFLGNVTSQNTLPNWFTQSGEVWFVNATPKNLTSNYNVSSASFAGNFSVNSQDGAPQGITFNNDGTKMYMVGNSNNRVYEYNLSTPFNVSTADFVDFLSVTGQENGPRGITFNNDGTKFYLVGDGDDEVIEYELSPAFDVSTATIVGALNVTEQEPVPTDLEFNNDGTKLYVIGLSTGRPVYQYNLSIPFNVSTGVFSHNFSASAQVSSPHGMSFNNDGSKMYIIGAINNNVSEYDLSTPFDVSTATFLQAFSVTIEETASTGMEFNNDGSKMYIIGVSNDSVIEYELGSVEIGVTVQSNSVSIFSSIIGSVVLNSTSVVNSTTDNLVANPIDLAPSNSSVVYEWYKNGTLIVVNIGNGTSGNTLSSSLTDVNDSWFVNATSFIGTNLYNVSNSQYIHNITVTEENTELSDVVFSTNGSKMFLTRFTSRNISEFDLSVPFNISTASFVQNFSVSAQGNAPLGVTFNREGTKMFVVGSGNGFVNEYTLTTGFDVSTASFSQNFSAVGAHTIQTGITFNSDGTKMYVSDEDQLFEYDLSVGFNISTASASQNISLTAQTDTSRDVEFSRDGTSMFIIGGPDIVVYEYGLTSGFDISTASFVQNFSTLGQGVFPTGIAFDNDGARMYVSDITNGTINEYVVGTITKGSAVVSNNLTITNLTISTPSTSSGGGGGGSSSRVSETEISSFEGFSGELREGRSITFPIGGESHKLTVLDIGENSVRFEILSDPIIVDLNVGETKKVDVTGGGYYDIQITLNEISFGKAGFVLKAIHERIEKEVTVIGDEQEIAEDTPVELPDEIEEVPKERISFVDSLLDFNYRKVVIVILALIFVALVVGSAIRRARDKKKVEICKY